MIVFPQLSSGTLAQFPVVKRRIARTVLHTANDGNRVAYADPAAVFIEWQLRYTDLSDDELAALLAFHAAAEGSLQGFTFVDPTANLLAWSEDFENSAWAKAPLLTIAGGVEDPGGETRAWRLENAGGGPQSIGQTLNAPAGYLYCFSVFARSSLALSITLFAGSQHADYSVLPGWTRFTLAGRGDPAGSSLEFSIELPAGGSMDLFGPQVEAQAAPSQYRRSTTSGVYENARLANDALRFTTTGVNRHSARVTIFYGYHL